MCNGHSLVASYSKLKFFCLILVQKKVWCYLSSLNKQVRVLAVTFHIILLDFQKFIKIFICLLDPNPSLKPLEEF